MANQTFPTRGTINILGETFEYSKKLKIEFEKPNKQIIAFVELTNGSINKLKKLKSHPYFSNMNRGSVYSNAESQRLDSGGYGCFQNKPPKESVKAFNDLKSAASAALGFQIKGGNCGCMTGTEIFNRANPGARTYEQCMGPGKNPLRSCKSLHGVGRAQDILNVLVGSITAKYLYFDTSDNYTLNSNVYKAWLWFANNAHKYSISAISNEWWHWQYFGPVSENGSTSGGGGDTTSDTTTSDTTTSDTTGDNSSNNEQPIEVSSYAAIMAMLDKRNDSQQSSSSIQSKKTHDNPEVLQISSPTLKQDELILEKAKEK